MVELTIDDELAARGQQLLEFEELLKVKLPEQYKDFLLKQSNGALLRGCFEYVFLGVKDETCVTRLLSPSQDEKSVNLLRILTDDRRTFSATMLPIGYTMNGDILCLETGVDNYGNVYLWKHEWEYSGDEDEEDVSMCLVARDFDSFLSSLK
jgi:hypothetical protein